MCHAVSKPGLGDFPRRRSAALAQRQQGCSSPHSGPRPTTPPRSPDASWTPSRHIWRLVLQDLNRTWPTGLSACSQPRLLLISERWQMCAWVDASAKRYAWPCERVLAPAFPCLARLRFGRARHRGAANCNCLERRRPTWGTPRSPHERQGYTDNSSVARLATRRCCAGNSVASSQRQSPDHCQSTVGITRAESHSRTQSWPPCE